ncbi:PPOX class F420-dependent oxidoreductase [Actinomycetospora lutea]|uniref:PPOX class F420-dependent oxidoreductase n=1 Tax=Actinomycetospora lutea TaxID=663604 RepID=UPI002366FE68|nr:PPOX class F420-dependent oxidoreductase [Actinomycetospora lutea]MDD7940295.1 PPOX class F420-dependent oxidoreductase [Actinomycetospora lutea]
MSGTAVRTRGRPAPEVVVGVLAGALLVGAAVLVPTGPAGVGVASLGVGVGLLLSVLWRDALVTLLVTALLVVGLGAGGGPVAVGAAAVLAGAAWWRWRRLGYVLGHVVPSTSPALRHLVEQKTVLLETFRRDGTAVATPVSIAVDGSRAVVRSFARAGKTKRLRRDPVARVSPCTARGVPTGPPLAVRCRLLEGEEAHAAARLLRRKYPLLHGVLVPLAHRVGRRRTGRTVHVELVPRTDPQDPATTP